MHKVAIAWLGVMAWSVVAVPHAIAKGDVGEKTGLGILALIIVLGIVFAWRATIEHEREESK